MKFKSTDAIRRPKIKTVSLLKFRKNAEKIMRWSQQGKRMVLTCRGRPVMRLEPVVEDTISNDDPFLLLDGIIGGEARVSR